MEQEKILVTGISGKAGKAVAQYFRRQGIYVIGVDENEDTTVQIDEFRQSLAVNSIYYLDQLLLLSEINGASLLVPTLSDELVEISFNRYNFIRKGVHVYIPPPFPIQICQDREALVKFLKRRGITFEDGLFSLGDNKTDLRFSRSNKWSAIRISPLKGRIYQGDPSIATIRIQQFYHKQNDVFYNVNLCIDDKNNHKTIAVQTLEISVSGNTTVVKKTKQKEAEEFCCGIAKALGLAGVVNISVKMVTEKSVVLLSVEPKVGEYVSFAPEVFDALCWLWCRDLGRSTDFFVPRLPTNRNYK